MVAEGGTAATTVVVREYDPKKDQQAVEEVENKCEVGPTRESKLSTHLLGDPMGRVRNSPAYLMLVAEMASPGGRTAIVGMIRGCIKTVSCGTKPSSKNEPEFIKLAYLLGLRVSTSHRRMGIGSKLVQKMEQWFVENGAEYSYLSTENDNVASLNLFTCKWGYTIFRTPSILVHPVFAHCLRLDAGVHVVNLTPADAEVLYRRRFSATEFFPRDIDAVLNNRLSLGTFLAVPSGWPWPGSADAFLASPPESWAVLSVWDCMSMFLLEIRGASRATRALAWATRAVDRALPWLRLPSVPELFRPFGLHVMYGLGGDGPDKVKMIRALFAFAHNLATEYSGCEVVAAEVAAGDPLKQGIPHWKSLSCEDVWCIKRLGEDYSDRSMNDWTKSPPGLSIFVDPREF